MDYSLLITMLRQKKVITDLEQDILDTWNELQKDPFDRSAAQKQVIQNNVKYPEIFEAIAVMPTIEIRPFDQASDTDIRYNLEEQFAALAANGGWQKYGQ